ncbi:hypothetical protein [Paracoccus sp. IB05]|uniref:hypothetical protein n=1 Tax=Paracoccus sp. IB05 TaxID=2779367 RepID=UPI0018E90A49|nr:hypothetical protein [Paracoccus sp. IB05]MBJ2154019.1 hypothetical protein [Paracoccus sp. IB05]
MTATKVFTTLASSMAGLSINHVWRGHGSAVFLEIGALTPTLRRDGSAGNPEGQIGLTLESSWRIEDNYSIICGSWSDDSLWQPSFDRLKIGRIVNCDLFGALPEVAITTDGGVRFVSFSTTDGQPQWSLVDRRNKPDRWLSIRGGRLHLGNGGD